MKPQTRHVLNYLREYRTMTEADASDKLGIKRLASRIYELRRAGYEINGQRIAVRNRHGETVHVTEYQLAANLPPTHTTWDADGRGLLPL